MVRARPVSLEKEEGLAQIEIERKSGTNWLPWLIGIALLALLAWWFLGRAGDPEPVTATGDVPAAVPPAPVAGAEGAITDWSTFTGDGAALVGRQVALASVPVADVVSDRGFWIGQDQSQRVFVVRTRQDAPGTPADGAVNAGQTVSVFGTVQAMPTDLTQATTEWNLQSTDATALSQQAMYIAADSVRIVQRP